MAATPEARKDTVAITDAHELAPGPSLSSACSLRRCSQSSASSFAETTPPSLRTVEAFISPMLYCARKQSAGEEELLWGARGASGERGERGEGRDRGQRLYGLLYSVASLSRPLRTSMRSYSAFGSIEARFIASSRSVALD